MTLGKPENLLNKLQQNVAKGNAINRQKSLDNPNNKRAASMLRLLIKQDLSLRQMAKRLNEEGFTTANGHQFTANAVRVLIKRYDLQ